MASFRRDELASSQAKRGSISVTVTLNICPALLFVLWSGRGLNLPRSGSTIFNSGLLCGFRISLSARQTKIPFKTTTYTFKTAFCIFVSCCPLVYTLISTHYFVFVGVDMTQETDEERKNRLREQGSANLLALFSNRFHPESNIYTGIYGNEFDAQILLKLDKRLKVAFQKTCEENGVTVSKLLRDFMREYVRAYHP